MDESTGKLHNQKMCFKKNENIQKCLNRALRYWFHDSINIVSLKEVIISKYFVDIKPIVECLQAFQKQGITVNAISIPRNKNKISTVKYAKYLANFYKLWEQNLPESRTTAKYLSNGQDYITWYKNGGFKSYYKAAHRLARIIKEKGSNFFLRAIIHGSVATLDDTIGFSDIDLAFIIRGKVLKSPKNLLCLRKFATKILTLTYSFDPFMHHGPYYISEIDLAWYPEAMFPSLLFSYGVDLLDESPEIDIWVRKSDNITDQMFDMFKEFFKNWGSHPFNIKDSYELEWLLGSTTLLPVLYMQRTTGKFYYKRDTFSLAENNFSHKEWEPIRVASEIRATLPPRPDLPCFFVWVAYHFCWPGLIQNWARIHPLSIKRAQESKKRLGLDYPNRVLKLLIKMQEKIISKEETKGFTKNNITTVNQRRFSSKTYFYGLANGPFINLPKPLTSEDYRDATKFLISYWTSLPQKPVAIYQIGQVGTPGISDLDFILVYPDRVELDWKKYQPNNFPKWIQELITHTPYVCTESLWEDLPYWYPIFSLEYLWGRELTKPVIPSEYIKGVSFGMLVDFLLVKIPIDFLLIAWSKPTRLRDLLCLMHSLKYTYALAEMAELPVSDNYKEVLLNLNKLRDRWFKMGIKSFLMLEKLTGEIVDLAGVLIKKVDELLKGGEYPLDINSEKSDNSIFNFNKHWEFEKAIQFSYKEMWLSGFPYWQHPGSFKKVLSFYAFVSPKLRTFLRNEGCKFNLAWGGGKWKEGLKLHALAIVKYAEKTALLGVPPQKYIALGYYPLSRNRKFEDRLLKKRLKDIIKRRVNLRKIIYKIIFGKTNIMN